MNLGTRVSIGVRTYTQDGFGGQSVASTVTTYAWAHRVPMSVKYLTDTFGRVPETTVTLAMQGGTVLPAGCVVTYLATTYKVLSTRDYGQYLLVALGAE